MITTAADAASAMTIVQLIPHVPEAQSVISMNDNGSVPLPTRFLESIPEAIAEPFVNLF